MMRVSKMGTYRCGGCDATAVLCDNVANKNAAVGLLCETCGGQVTWQDGRTLCAECGWTHAVTMGQSRERWQELSERWRKVKQQRQKEADKERRKAATREARQHLYPNWECPKCGESLWELESLSPNYRSATWKCGYCGRKEIVRKEAPSSPSGNGRAPIPKEVQREVWRRDQGRCVQCGSQENLEYDHIIPVSRGGANTARNIQLLCETCNRRKSNKIG